MDERVAYSGFEAARPRLRAIAYRLLGSLSDVDDALQETWLRLGRVDASRIENLDGWLTTTTARVCLNILRARRSRHEVPLEGRLPDPVVSLVDELDPEHEALVCERVGLAMLVVMDSLGPDERVAFVLHDVFAVPYSEIAPLVDRTPVAARQLASRARRRLADVPTPDPDLGRQREVVDAYFAAARRGDFETLLELLHPEVVMRSDGGSARPLASLSRHGRDAVAEQARGFASLARFARAVLVNGAAGAVVAPGGRAYAVMSFVARSGQIQAIDVIADPSRLRELSDDLAAAGHASSRRDTATAACDS